VGIIFLKHFFMSFYCVCIQPVVNTQNVNRKAILIHVECGTTIV